ncbi:MAG: hypothetical protein J5835_05230 [Bacteroidales bacterium]|nr:hypothetical protein [Bacteroidales bacterium]
MKKIFAILLILLSGLSAYAQETPAKFKLYGFARNYAVIDSREVSGGTHDLFYYMPKDETIGIEGTDLNSGLNWKFLSLTTRLGLDFSGYEYEGIKVGGKVEADFYSLNGTASASTIAQLRLRQAYITIANDLENGDRLSTNIGQTWHPLAADLPHGINLESGAPFCPFNRSPQLMVNWTHKDMTLTTGLLYLSQYLPMDAQENAKSVAPYKYGLPEEYFGITWKKGNFTDKLGFTNVFTKPVRLTPDGYKASGLLDAMTAFYYFQYGKDLFQIKGKVTYAMSGEHLNLLSGYGISAYDSSKHEYTYTPMQTLATFVSAQYGKKVQVLGMIGYMKQLGTTEDLIDPALLDPATTATAGTAVLNRKVKDAGTLWLNTAAADNIQQAVRLTPTILWNLGKLQFGLEYDYTLAQYGNAGVSRGIRGLYEGADCHWIGNHRVLMMSKFNF